MRFSMQALRLGLGALGVVALLGAFGAFLIFGGFTVEARVLLAVAVLLLGLTVAIDPQDVLGRVKTRQALSGGNLGLIVMVALAILAILNVLGARYAQRWDLTASQQFTLSEKTLSILADLEQPVQALAFYSGDDPRRADAEDLLKEYAVRSDNRISYEIVDPELEPTRAIALGVREFGTIVFQQGEKRQSTTGVSEQEFTTALLKLTRPEAKTVYFTQGHGERNLDDAGPEGYDQVRDGLQRDNYVVESVSLLTAQRVPANAAALIIAGPTQDFAAEEKQAIRDYLAGGGKVMLLKDPRTDVNLDDVFEPWGVSIGNDPVVDPASAFLGDSGIPVIQRYAFHTVTQNMRAASFFPFVAAISVPAQATEDVTVTPLAQSSERSWIETDPETANFDDGQDRPGPAPLVVAIETSATTQDPAAGNQQGPRRTRAVIFGDSDFVANNFLRVPSGNLDLFLNSANWLAEAEELITIRPRPQDTRQMFLTGVQMNAILVSSTIFLPLLVLIAGAAVWWTRR